MKILITGADRGIGLGFVKAFAQKDAIETIYATCLHPQKMWNHPKVKALKMDVMNMDDIITVSEKLKDVPLDILINNAGVYGKMKTFRSPSELEMDYDDFLNTYNINTLGTLRVSQTFLPHVSKSKRKLIVAISSAAGSLEARDTLYNYGYAMSKTSINMAFKLMHLEHPDIQFLLLHPGWVKTEIGGEDAPLTVEKSVEGMIKVMNTTKKKFSFFDYAGKKLAW